MAVKPCPALLNNPNTSPQMVGRVAVRRTLRARRRYSRWLKYAFEKPRQAQDFRLPLPRGGEGWGEGGAQCPQAKLPQHFKTAGCSFQPTHPLCNRGINSIATTNNANPTLVIRIPCNRVCTAAINVTAMSDAAGNTTPAIASCTLMTVSWTAPLRITNTKTRRHHPLHD